MLSALHPECAAAGCDSVPRNAAVCGCSELVGVEAGCFARAMVGKNFVAGGRESRTGSRVSDDLIPAPVVSIEKDYLDIDRPGFRRRLGQFHLTVLIFPFENFHLQSILHDTLYVVH